MIVVRSLHAGDAAAFRTLRLAALAAHPTAFASSVEDERDTPVAALAERLVPSAASLVLGAFDGERLVGMAGVQRERLRKLAHKAHIWGMYVDPAVRRRGVGRQLLDAAIARAAGMPGVRQLTLGVNAQNVEALALYGSRGFERIGLEPGFLLVDGVLHDEIHMVRFLDPR